jgi:hypothetical protein
VKSSSPPLSISHPRRGWAFWWRWVLATNLGWFPGIALGTWLAQPIAEGTPHLAAVASASVTALCFGGAQAFALRATLAAPRSWWFATAVAWPLGIGAARLLLEALSVDANPLIHTMLVAFIAGGCVGLPQARLLSAVTRYWRWWPSISAISWGLLFPGALAGLALVWWCREPDAESDAG